jgi:hypothetical protein
MTCPFYSNTPESTYDVLQDVKYHVFKCVEQALLNKNSYVYNMQGFSIVYKREP